MNYRELALRLSQLYQLCKDEKTPGARIRMIELRNLTPEVIEALEAAARDQEEWVTIPRLKD